MAGTGHAQDLVAKPVGCDVEAGFAAWVVDNAELPEAPVFDEKVPVTEADDVQVFGHRISVDAEGKPVFAKAVCEAYVTSVNRNDAGAVQQFEMRR